MPDELTAWIRQLFVDRALTGMGQAQRVEDLNLGLGWIYYGLARVARSQHVVVIGSYRGFTPMVFARALADYAESGRVTFIDPSMVDDFWCDPATVKLYMDTLRRDATWEVLTLPFGDGLCLVRSAVALS